jgi:hypothetical protein
MNNGFSFLPLSGSFRNSCLGIRRVAVAAVVLSACANAGGQARVPDAGAQSVTTAPVLTSEPALQIAAGTAFTHQIRATNHPTAYSAKGLPRGLSCDPATGIITGVTTSRGSFNATLSATNDSGTSVATQAVVVDGETPIELPVVRRVSLPATRNFKVGDSVTVMLEVDAPYGGLTVSGVPRVPLLVGGVVRYAEFSRAVTTSDQPQLYFSYAVKAADDVSAGIFVGKVIDQNGGAIRDRAGLACATSLAGAAVYAQ